MLKFSIVDKRHILNQKNITILSQAANQINKICKIKPRYCFDLNIVSANEIQKINKLHRKINKPTDVISFAFHDREPKTNLLGEIFINYDDKSLLGKHFTENFTLLFIHGILHLLLFDHATAKDQKIMFNLQNRVLEALNLLK
jgi:probable rRNA maturation factor